MDVELPCNAEDAQTAALTRQSQLSRREYLQGVGLLLIVVFLWTSSNFITQDIFDDGYEKPFLVTYLNTSSFAIYLIPWAVKWFVMRKASQASDHMRMGYEAIAAVDSLEAPTSALASNFRAPSIITDDVRKPNDLDPLTTRQTAQLASVFCIFWFIANWGINASLQFTSVASATVLSSTSGFFTLIVGRLFKVESMTLAKVLAVVTSFLGVALVSFSDSSTTRDDPTDVTSNQSVQSLPVLGDILALLGALFYALYVILLKVRIKEESRIDMQLFFGFVGLFNVLMIWPIALVLHFTGAETISAPPTHRALVAVLLNMFITLSSDYLYVLAMLKTTPLLVTVGLSLTIPLAIIGDFFLKKPSAPLAVLGALLVLGAFVLIGVANAKDTAQQKEGSDGSFEVEEVEPIIESSSRS
ncbi:uncharacterized protein FOMMEDRAFT_121223 [Fomitiporia mediterranea MF3/22]|uniref:uncharacterized protein n=1 Tax=Fomitiporia mediterranea (strain MF3/22) TaxID=694068 RepID=UPI0004407907|nr:uncharacterized protein FOMMEDRAFT_121223 [Fomitiporia mediterranea MF3/22]EJD03892.1 hypothetical protein FOMMEDRAFT_121223 [Fomitiporia mediterranea MF3/22]